MQTKTDMLFSKYPLSLTLSPFARAALSARTHPHHPLSHCSILINIALCVRAHLATVSRAFAAFGLSLYFCLPRRDGHELLGRCRMERHDRIKVRFGRAHLDRHAETLQDLVDRQADHVQADDRLLLSDAHNLRARLRRHRPVAGHEELLEYIILTHVDLWQVTASAPYRSTACFSVRPITPIVG